MQAGSVAWLEGGVWRPCLGTERKREPETEAETHGGPALKGEIDDTKGFPESVCVQERMCGPKRMHLILPTISFPALLYFISPSPVTQRACDSPKAFRTHNQHCTANLSILGPGQ